MASLRDMYENYRNYVKNIEWQLGRGEDIANQNDVAAIENWEKLQGIGPSNLGRGLTGMMGAIKVSHGSPHKFEKFDFTKIGTGEGAQAYGHGGYFAEGFDSPTAGTYKTAGIPATEYQDKIFLKNYHADQARARGDEEAVARHLKELEELQANKGGHLYNVSLEWPDAAREAADPLGEHHLLDWDKPLSEQPENLRSAIEELKVRTAKSNPQINWDDVTGGGLYQAYSMHRGNNPDFASEGIKDLGIPGIKYLDQGSRGAGQGTSNYVIFDENIPKILQRNGVSLVDLLKRAK